MSPEEGGLVFADRALWQLLVFCFEAVSQFVEFEDTRGIRIVLQVRQTRQKSAQQDKWKSTGQREPTIASSLFRSSSPDVRWRTCWSKAQASEYAIRAPSTFPALSSCTAVLAFWSALDNMAFWDGGRPWRSRSRSRALELCSTPFVPVDRLRECEWLRASRLCEYGIPAGTAALTAGMGRSARCGS